MTKKREEKEYLKRLRELRDQQREELRLLRETNRLLEEDNERRIRERIETVSYTHLTLPTTPYV